MPVLQLGNALSVVAQYICCFGSGYPMKGRPVVGSSIEEGGCRRRVPVYLWTTFRLHESQTPPGIARAGATNAERSKHGSDSITYRDGDRSPASRKDFQS
jgi:hypothetical protein